MINIIRRYNQLIDLLQYKNKKGKWPRPRGVATNSATATEGLGIDLTILLLSKRPTQNHRTSN